MTQQEKDTIREALRVYAAKYSSQKKAAGEFERRVCRYTECRD